MKRLLLNQSVGASWLLHVALAVAMVWAVATATYGSSLVELSNSALTNNHFTFNVFGFSGLQVTSILYLSITFFFCLFLGKVIVNQVLVNRLAIILYFAALAILDFQTAAVATVLVTIIFLWGSLLRLTGMDAVLAFTTLRKRLVYTICFVAMMWVMFGFTAASKTYPVVAWSWFVTQAPYEFIFGFWAPDIMRAILILALATASYCFGGLFFGYVSRHWSGPVTLLIVLVTLAPDRFLEAWVFLSALPLAWLKIVWLGLGVLMLCFVLDKLSEGKRGYKINGTPNRIGNNFIWSSPLPSPPGSANSILAGDISQPTLLKPHGDRFG